MNDFGVAAQQIEMHACIERRFFVFFCFSFFSYKLLNRNNHLFFFDERVGLLKR